MNERIKLFAEESFVITTDGKIGYVNALMVEKFAELLVRECARVVNIWSDEVPCSEGYDKFTVGKLKEHFGVDK